MINNIAYLAIGLLLISSSAASQNPSSEKLQWQIIRLTDVATGESANFACTFITEPNQPLKWEQKNGQHITVFSVQYTEGSWTDISQQGSVAYVVKQQEQIGKITFARDGNGLWVQIDLERQKGNNIKYRFAVGQVDR